MIFITYVKEKILFVDIINKRIYDKKIRQGKA